MRKVRPLPPCLQKGLCPSTCIFGAWNGHPIYGYCGAEHVTPDLRHCGDYEKVIWRKGGSKLRIKCSNCGDAIVIPLKQSEKKSE